MLKILKEMKQKDDIEFKRFSDKVNYQVKTFEKENDSKMKKLNSQRRLNNKSKQQSSLWANAIKNRKF